MMTPEQFAKLPRYARWEIERLRANEQYAEKLAAEAEANMLHRGTIVTGPDSRFDFIIRDGNLEITAYDGVLQVEPRASNSITLRNARFV